MAMRAPFEVRRLEPSDVPPILAVARSLDKWFNAEGLRRIAAELTSPQGLVAIQAGRLVGFVMWRPADVGIAELTWMGVAEDVQRRGIGTALLAALEVGLRSAGFRILEVSTVADRVDYEPYARTRRFYRARGFVDHRTDPLYWGTGEDRYDRLVMRLVLEPTKISRV